MRKSIFLWFYFFAFTGILGNAYGENSSFEEKLKESIHYSNDGPNYIGYIHIPKDRAIDQSTFIDIKLSLEHYKKMKVCSIFLDLDTPGGEVFSAMQIVNLLQKIDTEDHIPVIAFIDNWAVSAGAMLAYSCRFIGATNTSIMGAAEPVLMKAGGEMESASEKVNSALRAEFANIARFYGREPLLAEAMVDKDMILVLRGDKIIQLDDEEKAKKSDVFITRKGKLLTLDAVQLKDLGVADFFVEQQSIPPISEKEVAEGTWPAHKELAFHAPNLAKIPNVVFLSYHDWRAGFFSFLTHPAVASFLVFGLIIGIYLEMSSPGFGLGGGLAVTCLALILLSSFAIKAVNWIEVIIFCTGLLLLILEFFVLPTFGVAGILGFVFTIVGLFLLMLPHMENVHFTNGHFSSEQVSFAMNEILKRLAWFCGAIVLSVLAISFLGRFLAKRKFFYKRLISSGEQEASLGYVAGRTKEELPKIHARGVTVSTMRPSGKIEIEGKTYDAFSEGGFIDGNTPIFVYRIEGNKIIVRAFEEK